MQVPDRERFEARAAIMKALAHPSRLMMVHELGRGERCVCDLTELVGHDMSTVSKHLNILKKSGIVQDEKRGKQVYYKLCTPCVLNFFHCMESLLTVNLRRLKG
ncbi:MAG: ArsR/SmtB family transcription factor [Desulfovibrionaceae bacterium]